MTSGDGGTILVARGTERPQELPPNDRVCHQSGPTSRVEADLGEECGKVMHGLPKTLFRDFRIASAAGSDLRRKEHHNNSLDHEWVRLDLVPKNGVAGARLDRAPVLSWGDLCSVDH